MLENLHGSQYLALEKSSTRQELDPGDALCTAGACQEEYHRLACKALSAKSQNLSSSTDKA